MNFKATCIWLTLIAATGFSLLPSTAVSSAAEKSYAVVAGGQAPPPAAGGSAFAVRVATNLDRAAADSLKQDLVNEGFAAAQARPGAQGSYEVVIPGMTSRAQAEGIVSELKGSGYTTSVEVISEDGATAASAGETIYRVKVAEFNTAADAEEASKVLVDEGFVNVDVTEENGKQVLMLGTFNRQSEAEALLGDVNRAGFAMASVVTKERLRSNGATAADVSGLPASEQALAREVLAMAQKVESGDASAAEVKRLREMVQQMTSTQRQVLNQQETGRAASRDKNQKIFQLYRDFDKAINAQDYTQAEQILNQVRLLDPDDIFLPQRVATLENRRAGGTGTASGAGAGRPDPAKVQQLLNEGRAAETAGNPSLARQKFDQVLAIDPTNVEAKTKVAQLSGDASTEGGAESAGGLMDNKPLVYGAAGAVLFIILLLLWMKSRGGKSAKEATPAAGTSFGSVPDYSSNLGGGLDASGSANTTPAGGLGTTMAGGLAGAGMAGYHSTSEPDEEEEAPPTPAPIPSAPAVEESDTVSLDEFEQAPQVETTPVPSPEEETVSVNMEEEFQAPVTEPPGGSKAMDADLEALLKGTFGGTEEPETGSVGVAAGAGAVAGVGAGADSSSAPHLVFDQSFDSDDAGASPSSWRGEYDYATLLVEELGEPGHQRALKYEKQDGAGSATYHLGFPKVSGNVTVEFDLRCDQKNKFLLGVYLEHEEDFKQSIHTIVHQLDPNAPASLRVQGEGVPYTMGEWSHLKYEIDLINGKLDAYMNDNHVVQGAELAVVPEYLNTLSIRDNLATTGTLYIDNIQISEQG